MAKRRKKSATNLANPSGQQRGHYVHEQLRADIENHVLQPGDRVREIEISERLGVSRTPVRDALKLLLSEGLVVFAPPKGFMVAEVTPRQVAEIMSLREVLEGAAARFAAERASELEVQSLRFIHGKEPPPTPEDASVRDRQFHQAICEAAHNDYLMKAMSVIRNAYLLLGIANYSVPGRIEAFWREHGEIINAIARHDPEAAERMARKHIQTAARIRLSLMLGEYQTERKDAAPRRTA